MRGVIARVAGALGALVVCAWFAIGIRQAHDINAVRSLLSANTFSAADARHADALLHSASLLNPDRTVDILRGEVATAAGDLGRAQQILEGVTRDEPKNLAAWVALAGASSDNKVLFLRAYDAARRLEPRLPSGS